MTRIEMDFDLISKAYACSGQVQPNKLANLLKYVVHTKGSTKPSHLLQCHRELVLCLAYYAVLYCCYVLL